MSIKNTRIEPTTDGHKRLVKVTFTPEVPDPSNQFDVEVIFQVWEVDINITSPQDAYAIFFLSSTRKDTREHYVLSESQREGVVVAALSALADEDAADYQDLYHHG